jgi:proline iminopeptidase
MKTFRIIVYFQFFFSILNGQEINSFKTSDGETLFYAKTGTGPVIVLLCGGPGLAASYLQPWADTLSDNFECIIFDQRGTGLSTDVKLDSTTINLQRAVLDIDDLRMHLGKRKISLCGFSWGGGLAQAYAANFPKNVNKIVLVSSMGPDMTLMSAFTDNINMRRYPNEIDSLNYFDKQPENPNTNLKKAVFFFLPYVYDHQLGYNLLLKVISTTKNNPKMNELMMKDLYKNYDLKSKLPHYKGQCIIIKPRQDVTPEETTLKIKDLLPKTKYISIERSGHFPDLENPKSFYPALRKAFSKN